MTKGSFHEVKLFVAHVLGQESHTSVTNGVHVSTLMGIAAMIAALVFSLAGITASGLVAVGPLEVPPSRPGGLL